jgi:hypothetical protein
LRDENDPESYSGKFKCTFPIVPPRTIQSVQVQGKKRQCKILNKKDRKIFLDWASKIFTTKGMLWEDVFLSWGLDADGDSALRQTTGQQRVVLHPSKRHLKTLKAHNDENEIEDLVAEPGTTEQERALTALTVRVRAGLAGLGHIVKDPNETEFLATPPESNPQSPHRDGFFNWLVVVIPLAKGRTKSTYVAKDYACQQPDPPLSNLEYHQWDIEEGGAFVFHACHPHYGPGNQSKTEWRFVIFMSFALDEEAEKHDTDEHVVHF